MTDAPAPDPAEEDETDERGDPSADRARADATTERAEDGTDERAQEETDRPGADGPVERAEDEPAGGPDAGAPRTGDPDAGEGREGAAPEGEPSDADELAGATAPAEDAEPAAEAEPSDAESMDGEPAEAEPAEGSDADPPAEEAVPEDVRKYDRFQKIDGGTYDRANEFLRDRTYITAREWAIARLCADFRTETGVEMTKIGENLPRLVPFMTDTYTPQAVNQARASFEEKVRKAGATFLYGAMCDFFTAEELDDVMYEATEVAKFLLEVEGVDLSVEEELEAEDRISSVMREVREHSAALRHDEVSCPECGTHFEVGRGAGDGVE